MSVEKELYAFCPIDTSDTATIKAAEANEPQH